MDKSFYNSSWYRVADLKPRLRSHASIGRQHYRGQLWYVLQDPASGRLHRFTPAAYVVISMLDGKRTVREIWETACQRLGDDALTQNDMIRLLSQLYQVDVLHTDAPPDVEEMAARAGRIRRRKLVASVLNPMAVRLPLLDPDRFLNATIGVVRPLYSWWGAAVVCTIICIAAILAGEHWPQLTENVADRVLLTSSIVTLILVYPFVKVLHELGHAYAVKRWGGEVHELGVMLLVFMPVPYVDASSAAAFQDRRHRMVVGAAGIIVELVLASLALFVWLNVEEGLVRAIAFNVMLIGGVSTVVFNGNPLLRFDGYYVLADLLDIPNLADRCKRYVGYLIVHHVFGVREAENPASAPGEPFWFLVYGIASFLYRLVVVAAIALYIATRFFIIGTILAIWAAIMMLGVPLAKNLWFVFRNPILGHRRRRAIAICLAALVIASGALLLVPLPYGTMAEGIIWSSGEPTVYAGTDGVIVELLARPNARVRVGDPLMRLEDPLLNAEVRVLEGAVKEYDLRRLAAAGKDPFQTHLFEEQLNRAKGELELRLKRQANLVVRSPASGRFIVKRPDDLIGKFAHKGEVLAFVATFDRPTALVVVPEESADLVRSQTTSIDVRIAGNVARQYSASVTREVPNINNLVPSIALSNMGGGEIAMDPRDLKNMKALTNILHMELNIDSPVPTSEIGERVYVLFHHGYQPLAWRLYLGVRQLFLRRFSV